LNFAEPDKLAPPAAEGTAEPADRARVGWGGGSATPFQSGGVMDLGIGIGGRDRPRLAASCRRRRRDSYRSVRKRTRG